MFLRVVRAAGGKGVKHEYVRVVEAYRVVSPMTVENGQLTASFKVSRGQVLAVFRAWREHGGGGFVRLPNVMNQP